MAHVRFPVVVSGLVVVTALVACGGKVGSVSDCPPGAECSSPGDGRATSSGGTSGGGSGSGGSSSGSNGDAACVDANLAARRVCVPGVAQPGVPLSLTIDAAGCLPCQATLDCSVLVSSAEIHVALASRTCTVLGGQACPAVCLQQKVTCQVPPLAAGAYDVVIDNAAQYANRSQLVVGSDPSPGTSCDLPPDDTGVTIEGASFSTSCSDDSDCMLASLGAACGAVHCPNGAIAKTEQARYEAEARAKRSQCLPHAAFPTPSCPAFRPVCKKTGDALTGTCSGELAN